MKIKNILALGLIAVVSGISIAQTYTATAGTSGVADIQSDYSMATGDGASVSVDVPLEFELPKKVAIAIHDGTSFTSNPLFSGLTWDSSNKVTRPSTLQTKWNGQWEHGSYTKPVIQVSGAVYTNTDNVQVSLSNSNLIFTHESDPNSQITMNSSANGDSHFQTDGGIVHPASGILNLNASELIGTSGISQFSSDHYFYKSSYDTTDRSGKYLATKTYTVTVL